ncbi:MAG: hypothetical protein C0401_03745 [Anaerolinea sp.]|nr:hypothetical protein [Anaerolinea sp.]
MKPAIIEVAKKIASHNYTIEVINDLDQEDGYIYLAKNPELFGCMGQGKTIDEALENLRDARIEYIGSLLEDGLPVPAPSTFHTLVTAPMSNYKSSNFKITRTEIRETGIPGYSINENNLSYKMQLTQLP